MRHLFACVLFAVTGCTILPSGSKDTSPPDTAEDAVSSGTVVEPKSGTRLRALYWKRGTTVATSNVFRDTKLDELCAFVPTDDGVRCLPFGSNDPTNSPQVLQVYLDCRMSLVRRGFASGPTRRRSAERGSASLRSAPRGRRARSG
jgi:hypothetical protein